MKIQILRLYHKKTIVSVSIIYMLLIRFYLYKKEKSKCIQHFTSFSLILFCGCFASMFFRRSCTRLSKLAGITGVSDLTRRITSDNSRPNGSSPVSSS